MTSGIPRQPRVGRPRPFGRRIANGEAERLTARHVVGMAHVIIGAIGLLTSAFMFVGVVASYGARLGDLLVLALPLLASAASIVAGLWLREGRRRGAALAAVVDGSQLMLLLLVARDRTLDLILSAALLGAVIWLWPALTADEARLRERV